MDKDYQQMLMELYTPQLLDINSPSYLGNTNNTADLPVIPNTFLEQAISQDYDFLPQFLKPAQTENINFILPKKKPTGITASKAAINLSADPIAIEQGFVDTDEEDKEDFSTSPTQATGIAKLFEFLSRFTPLGLVRGGLESLKAFNQRIRDNDFAQSKSMEEYLEKRRRRKETEFLGSDDPQGDIITYDPAKTRNRQRIMNMQPSKRDTERGKIKTRTRTSAPKRDLYSDAKSAFTSSR
jgi:hypothetical protein